MVARTMATTLDRQDARTRRRFAVAIVLVSVGTWVGTVPNRNDVSVTKSGKRDETAIGRLTNTLLAGVR
jgi:hypothetical protein